MVVVAFSHGINTKATLEITDHRSNQVVIRFIPYRGEHITLHRNDDNSIVRTHYKDDKERSVWDEARVGVATAMDIPNPERHGNYVINTPLPKMDNLEGFYLGGRSIDLSSFTPRARYSNNINYTFNCGFVKFTLQIYLSTAKNSRNNSVNRIVTSLGELCFEFKESQHDVYEKI